MSLSSRRMILPDLVFGRSVPNSTALGRAILPIRSPTHSRGSPASSSEGSLPARSSTKGWIPFERPGRRLEPFHELLGPPEPEALVVALSLLVDRGVLDDGLSCELGRGREGAPLAHEHLDGVASLPAGLDGIGHVPAPSRPSSSVRRGSARPPSSRPRAATRSSGYPALCPPKLPHRDHLAAEGEVGHAR